MYEIHIAVKKFVTKINPKIYGPYVLVVTIKEFLFALFLAN